MPVTSPEYHQAFLGKDSRFDGRFVAGARTTRIYCKPSCSTKMPPADNVEFFDTPDEAEAEGYRACRKCRPDVAPGTPAWNGTSATVSRALRLIEDGVLDRTNIDALCERLGIGARQLRRLFRKHLGTSPVQVARMRRADFARRLIETTGLSMTHVAEAAGFGSIRRFNAVMNEVYGCPPTSLRKGPARGAAGLDLEIPVRAPFAWSPLLASLEAGATPGVESVIDGRYIRVARFKQAVGEVSVTFDEAGSALRVRVSHSLNAYLLDVVSGVRRLFDVEAEMGVIEEHLATDPTVAKCMRATPGLRVLGSFDRFETAVMTLLGQHICNEEAMDLATRIIDKYGRAIETSESVLTHAFPTPYALSSVRLEALGVPKRRSKSIQALAKAVHEGALRLDGTPSLDEALRRLRSIPGVGTTTADYVAMRVYREPDAFPSHDQRLRAAASHDEGALSPADLEARAESWRPWRAYAAMWLWDSVRRDEPASTPYFQGNRETMVPAAPTAEDQVA
ncbi:MAG: AlkA N-terminal domain-containing protein [Myxococcota bacterium]